MRKDTHTPPVADLTIIAAGVRVMGTVVATGDFQLNGHIEGDLKAASVTVGPTGSIRGDVHAETITLAGLIEGCMHETTIEIADAARFRGDLTYEALSIARGADVEGKLIKSRKSLDVGTTEAARPELVLAKLDVAS